MALARLRVLTSVLHEWSSVTEASGSLHLIVRPNELLPAVDSHRSLTYSPAVTRFWLRNLTANIL
jgi:hypothetical protein